MLFKEMVFEIIKSIIGSTETDFTYSGYLNNEFEDDYRVQEAENAIFLPINTAIARLHDLQKIRHFVYKLACINGEVLLPAYIKDVYAVQDYSEKQYQFIRIYTDELILKNSNSGVFRVLVEATKNKKFSKEDFDIELEEFGITDEMCFYIAEYVLGKVLLETSPSEATIHINTAESYFTNLPTATMNLKPSIDAIYKI